MNVTTYYSLPALLLAGRQKATEKTVISFDLFDTLLIRRIHDPDLVKLPVARYIAMLAKSKGVACHQHRVQELRDTIEKRHRLETGQRFVDQEACYPRFMEELLRHIFAAQYSPELLAQVTDYELTMENSMLVVRDPFKVWMEELFRQGKRLFIISDMYLPATHLRRLVDHAGIEPYVEEVISSADTFLAKASGKAFAMIAEKYGLAPQDWLHVGDNPISDGLRPVEMGIEALVLSDVGEAQRKSLVKRYYNYSDGKPFWRGRVLQQLMAPLEGEDRPQSSLYREGYTFLGTIIGLFVQEVARYCLEKGIRKIFFLSREGWTFKRYWEQAMPLLYPEGGLPEIEYLYVSRMALAGASCAHQGLTKANADIVFLPTGNRDFRDVCRIFALEIEPLLPHLQRYQLEADSALSPAHQGYTPNNRQMFDALLEDGSFQEEVRRQTRVANEAAVRYFESVGLFAHEHIALVDIGWLGTIQRFLFETIAHRPDCPTCHGLLFGATRGIPYPEGGKNLLRGIVYDRYRFDFAASVIIYAQDIFEEACRAPHPTLNGYRLTETGAELEFRKVDDDIGKAEVEQDNYFAPLQQGIFDSAGRFAAAAALLGYQLEDCRGWMNYMLVSKLAFPTAREVADIRHLHHLDDFHGGKKPQTGLTLGPVPLWRERPWKLKFHPWLRLRHFLGHLRGRINQ